MTPKDLEANHFNPGIVSRIAQAQAAIDAAATPHEAYQAFAAMAGNDQAKMYDQDGT